MLSQIRSLSQNAVVLILFGMLIFVFVFFFGLPSQGLQQDAAALNSQWGARVNGEQLPLSEAFFFAQRRGGRNQDAMRMVNSRLDEMIEEAALSQRAESMGWRVDLKSAARFALSAENLEQPLFTGVPVEVESNWGTYKESEGETGELRPVAARLSSFQKAQGEKNPTKTGDYRRWVSGWGLGSNQYITMKQRELQLRSYLRFLSAQLVSSRHAAQDQFEGERQGWRFTAVKITGAHAPPVEAPSDEKVQQRLSEREDALRAQYKERLDDYSKSRLRVRKFFVPARDGRSMADARKLLETFKGAVAGGSEVSAALKAHAGVERIELGWRRRSNLDAETFNALLERDPATEAGFGATSDAFGSVELYQVMERELGEEKSFDEVKLVLAREEIIAEAETAAAKLFAETKLAELREGKALSVIAEEINGTQATPEATSMAGLLNPAHLNARAQHESARVEVKESGEVKLGALSKGLIAGFEEDKTAATALLTEIFKVSAEAPVIPAVIPHKGGWLLLSQSDRNEPSAVDYQSASAKAELVAQRETQSRFFGMRWQLYQLFGTGSFYYFVPRDLVQALFTELRGEGFGPSQESFLDQSLKSSVKVERNPAFDAALLRAQGS